MLNRAKISNFHTVIAPFIFCINSKSSKHNKISDTELYIWHNWLRHATAEKLISTFQEVQNNNIKACHIQNDLQNKKKTKCAGITSREII